MEDQGDLDGPWQALQEAIRAEPDNPGAAVLEVSLLCASGESARAGQRADFWYRRLIPLAEEMPEALALLERARDEPCAVFREFGKAGIDRDLGRVIEWLPHGSEFAWQQPEDWLDWLARHPEAADSLDIIDDSVSLVFREYFGDQHAYRMQLCMSKD